MHTIFCWTLILIPWTPLSPAETVAGEQKPAALSQVERSLIAIELKVQLQAYEKIVSALYETQLEAVLLEVEPDANRGERLKLEMRLRILVNLKETAKLHALELAEQLNSTKVSATKESGSI